VWGGSRLNEEKANLPNLPEGWEWSSFVELAVTKANTLKAGPFGSALKKSSYVTTGFKVYGQEQVIRNDPYCGDYYIGEDKFNELISCSVEPKDILISLVGTIGKFLVLPDDIKPGIINPRLVKLSLYRRITSPEYVKLYVESSSVKKYFSMVSHGGTMEILNLKILKLLPMPPLNEQRRIAEKIEALTARSRKARTALDEIPALLDQFRQSVLAAAFRGDLTADWRAQNPNVEPSEVLLERIRTERRDRWEENERSNTLDIF
jgi:type I restriction enzyme S subunit